MPSAARDLTSIRFNDARSMAVTSYLPIVAVSLLLAVFCHDLAGIAVAVVVLLGSLLVFLRLRKKILVSARRAGEEIEFQTIGGAHVFGLEQVRSGSVYGFQPAFTIVMVIWLAGRVFPVVLFAGALSTNAGSYEDTIEQLRGMVPGTPGGP